MKQIDMAGKLCVVTGANAGIGKETALGLAQMGAHVVMICRHVERGTAAQADIIQKSHHQQVDLLVADLSSQAEIRRVAAELKQRYERLDVLINNAGAMFNRRQESVDGIEMTFALNHLGYFLLTHCLLDLMQASAPARIVNVASGAHYSDHIHFDDLGLTQGYKAFKAYAQSKLANVLFTYELARRLEGTGVTANCLHPGFVASSFGKNSGFLMGSIIFVMMQLFAISAKRGAETPLYLASSPAVEGVTGKYFDKCQSKPSADVTYDESVAQRLWMISEQMTGLTAEE